MFGLSLTAGIISIFLSITIAYGSLLDGDQDTKAVSSDALADSYLEDVNGNGVIEVLAFGDSITRGTGDFTGANEEVEVPFQPTGEAGYPLRLEGFLGLSVANRGIPGERLSEDGIGRFSRTVQNLHPDIVVFSEGANDAFAFLTSGEYFRLAQTAVNIANATGVQPVLMKIVPPCCNHSGQRPFVDGYNTEMTHVALANNVPVVDIPHAFGNICSAPDHCRLVNQPEGIHPNDEGYTIIAENVAATLLKIDLFSPEGAAELESALGLPAGTVKTKPDVAPAAAAS